MTTQEATLLAAGIAAGASLLKLVIDAVSARGQAARAAHRSILETHLGPVGQAIHEITAGVTLVHRRTQLGQAPGNASTNAQSGATELKQRRLLVKYSLDGLDEPFRVMTRAPDWVLTYKGDKSGDQLVVALRSLSKQLDELIGRSYRRGRPPTWMERRRIRRDAGEVRDIWERRFGREPDPD